MIKNENKSFKIRFLACYVLDCAKREKAKKKKLLFERRFLNVCG